LTITKQFDWLATNAEFVRLLTTFVANARTWLFREHPIRLQNLSTAHVSFLFWHHFSAQCNLLGNLI